MVRLLAVSCVVVLAAVPIQRASLAAQTPAAAAPAPAPAEVTPQSVAAFLGDWTLAAEGPNGPSAFDLTIKVDAGKVVAEIASDILGKQPIASIEKSGTGLLLKYGFDYQGNTVSAAVTLTPVGDKIGLKIDFADGAYLMEGSATKKAAK